MKQASEEKSRNIVLSIIIATYNAEAFIKGCLESIIENVFESYELVIIDGKSTDSTLEIISNFKDLNHTVISEPDKGIYDAMNKGISHASGKWVMFLGADDRILPSFKDILPYLTDPGSVYYGNCRNADHQLGGRFSAFKLAKMNLCHQAVLYPLAALKKYRFNLHYPVFADYLLNMQCWGDQFFTKTYVDTDLAYYHMEGFSSTAKDPDFKQDKPKLVKKHLGYLVYLKYMFRKYKESKKPGSKFF